MKAMYEVALYLLSFIFLYWEKSNNAQVVARYLFNLFTGANIAKLKSKSE